jgi:predicted metal-dependent enzyme (double-stranded beta helix superfamily)
MEFDIERFVADARSLLDESTPHLAIEELLERALISPAAVLSALPATRAEIVPLYTSERLSVLSVVWAPGMAFRPHNHLMWAAIGLYAGQEDNIFYRRSPAGLVSAGRRVLHVGDVALLGTDTVHSVKNPKRTFTAAIHVYGGDITCRPGRSEWEEPILREVPYDFERTRRYFDLANEQTT